MPLTPSSIRLSALLGLLWGILLCATALRVGAQEAPPGTGAHDERVILVLGDSLAAGRGVDPGEAFPALLEERIKHEGWNFTVVNAGVSGDTTAGGLRRLDWLLQRKIAVLLIELGGNDGLRGISPKTTRANLQALIDRAKKKFPEVRIVIAGMKMPPNLGPDYTRQFENVFPEVAKKNKALLIPFLLEGVGGRPELNQADRIHPTAEGQRIVADNVWKVIRPLLKELADKDSAG